MKTLLTSVFFALTLSIFFSTNAQARYWVEPSVGYTTGKLNFGNGSYDTDGIYYGIRGGTYFKKIKLGASIQTGSTKIKAETTTDAKVSQLGLYAGIDVVPKLNLFTEYFFSSSIKFDNSNAKWKSNVGYRLGFLYTGLPLYTLGLKYKMIIYNDTDDSTFSGAALKDDPTIEAFEVVVGLRF